MHVGVFGAVEIGDAVDDLTRFLRARPGIEKNQTGIIFENRELALDAGDVETGRQKRDRRLHSAQRCYRHTLIL